MNILLWAPYGAGTHYWGPGTSAFRLYKNLKDNNIKVTLVHASSFQGIFPDVYYAQIQIGNLDSHNKIDLVKYLINSYRWIKTNHHKYDIFHGISAFVDTFIPALFFNQYNKNTFIKLTGEHGGFGSNSLISKLLGIKRLRLTRANKIGGYISISTDVTNNLLKHGVFKEKIYLIPNGVDTRRFHPITEQEKSKLRKQLNLKDIFTICYIGGLTYNKNVLEIIKAVHELKNLDYQVQFLIVGPDRSKGKEEKKINDYIYQNNLQDFCIRIEHTDKPETYYQAANVFILNSKSEGLSNSLLEAMSCGLVCIAYPASGTIDLIENERNGYISNGNSKQIGDLITKLYEDRTLLETFSIEARNKIIKSYSIEHIISQHIELFKSYCN